MDLLTKNGHSLFEISSLLQKSIRRGDEVYSGYAVNELRGRYNDYLWKRLLIISAEDCWGCITKEIIALREADEIYNRGKKGYDRCGEFISKAVTLMLKAWKNRDSDWYACNMIQSEKTLNITEYLSIPEDQPTMRLPAYTFDVHTSQGKRAGKTRSDMIKDEQLALFPHKEGDYDKRDWNQFHESMKRVDKGIMNIDNNYPEPTKEQLKELDKSTFDVTRFFKDM